MGKVTVIVDGQFGSTGKAKLAAFIADKEKPDAVACDFMTNAGHTWVGEYGRKIMTQHIPTGAIHTSGPIFLGPGCAITPNVLLDEIEALREFRIEERIRIHPHAVIIQPHHIEEERFINKRIASTMKGCGAAVAGKIRRKDDVVLAKHHDSLKHFCQNDYTQEIAVMLNDGAHILAEGAQGFSLSIDHGFYPYVTSRNITPGDILLRCGIPLRHGWTTWGSLRTFPIRVGNIEEGGRQVGYSGGTYEDQVEMTWGEVAHMAGYAHIEERTTVTNRVRRVFGFSMKQLQHFMDVCNPDYLFLNFVNYYDKNTEDVDIYSELPESIRARINHLQIRSGGKLRLLGMGAKHNQIVII